MKALYSGTVRERKPEDTLKVLSNSLAFFDDWISVSDDTNLCPFGSFPIYQVRSRLGDMIHTSQGKGLTRTTSLVSAWMENLENRCLTGRQQPPELQNKSFRQLKAENIDALDPVLCCHPQLPKELHDLLREEQINWSLAKKLSDNSEVYIPSARLFHQPLKWWSEYLFPLSNGLASGNSLLESQTHGLLELIERQSRVKNKLDSSQNRLVDIQSLPEPLRGKTLELLAESEALSIIDLTHHFGVPTFEAELLLTEKMAQSLGQEKDFRLHTGSGSHGLAEVAILRAITECVQCVACLTDGIKENIASKRPLHKSLRQNVSKMKLVDFEKLSCLPETQSFEDELRQLVDGIQNIESVEVYSFNYQVPIEGIDVSMCLAPGFTYPSPVWMEQE